MLLARPMAGHKPETLPVAYRRPFLTSCRRRNADLIKVEELSNPAD